MPNAVTLGIAVAVVAVVVYALGVDRTKEATARTASTTKRAATSGFGVAAGGAMAGLAAGDALLQFVASDPATLIAGVTGVLGTLGLSGVVDITPLQFALIAIGLLVGYYAIFGEATEGDT
jgi:hypothetical protein